MLRQAVRYYHTLRHLRLAQTVGRVYPEIKKRAALRGWMLTRLPAVPSTLSGQLRTSTGFLIHDPWNTRAAILEGRFCFLRREEKLGRPVMWEPEGLSIFWRYNLHYFHYLRLLRPEEQEALCLEWTRSNPPGQTVGWWPYPTSLRIVNWCKAGVEHPDLLRSLYEQAAYLARNMERYIQGNHWLENAKALVFAGCYLEGQGEAAQWVEHGLKVLRKETPQQVLPDGGNFERSPMYHALMLEAYLDLVNVLPEDRPERAACADVARRMADFLVSVTKPDGHIALFNDAAQEIAPSTESLTNYAERLLGYQAEKRDAFPETGYFIYETPDVHLVVDAGPVGPDYLPAHAHADIFSFELTVAGRPFVVDSGTSTYEAGAMRAYQRSTRAHNTVEVDGADQAECWSSFRVARRFAPQDVSLERTSEHWRFSGRFDGYRHLIGDGIVHCRQITGCPEGHAIRVEDVVQGHGAHRVASRLHLHPAVTVRLEGVHVVLERDGIRCTVTPESSERPAIEDGWYGPAFGVECRCRVLVFERQQALPATLAYVISYDSVAP